MRYAYAMSSREIKISAALILGSVLVISGVGLGLESLGARDELTAVLVIATFAGAMLVCGFVLDRYTSFPKRR
jgi:hypothetical protein